MGLDMSTNGPLEGKDSPVWLRQTFCPSIKEPWGSADIPVGDLLDFSMVESGKPEIETIGFNSFSGETVKTLALRV
jgi:hypothetical protein